MGELSTVTRGSSRCHPRGLFPKIVFKYEKKMEGRTKNSKNVPNNENSWILRQLVLLSTYFKIDLTPNSIAEINLAIDQVGKRGCTRIF